MPPNIYASPPGLPEHQVPQPPRTNAAAIIGFVASLIFCIPLLTQLVGLVLGIVGISLSGKGGRGGRGLGIAAVVISLVVGALWCLAALVTVPMIQSAIAVCKKVPPLMSATEADLPALVAEIREQAFSERLKLQVDDADVISWVHAVLGAHGPLEGFQRSEEIVDPNAQPGEVRIHLIGHFERGKQDIFITLGATDRFNMQLDNVRVGELVLAPEQ